MKKINLKLVLFFTTLIITIFSCIKLEKAMLVSTGEATNIQFTAAEVSGTIVDIGEGATQYGHYYSKTADPSKSGQKTSLGKPDGTGSYTSRISDLEPGTKYYVTAYIGNGVENSYGEIKSFNTPSLSVPALSTNDISLITTTTASGGGNVTADGGAAVTSRGICWSTNANPTIEGSKTSSGSGTGSFTSNLTGLNPGTKYYVRAYAANSVGTGYGDEKTFTTTAAARPSVVTVAATEISFTTATSGGNVTTDGGMPVTARGVCWNTSGTPTITDSKTSDATGTGVFVSRLTGLAQGTKYYVRAFATNFAGTSYGEEISFTTLALTPPTLTGPSSATDIFNLSWTFAWPVNISADDHYELEWSYSSTSGFVVMATYNNGVRTSPITEGIAPEAADIGKTSYFRVRAKSNGIYSPYSNVVGVSIPYIDISFYPAFDNLVMESSSITSYQTSVYSDWSNGVGNSYTILTLNSYLMAASAIYFNIDNFITGGTIQKAVLKLYVQNLPGDIGTSYAVNALSGSWSTNTLTFNNLPLYYTTPEAVQSLPVSTSVAWEVDITSIVQSWANGSRANNGIIIRDKNFAWPASSVSRVTDFYSNDNAPEGKKPVLYIEIR